MPISEELRREVGRQIKEMQGCEHQPEMVFDVAQSEVERLINNTTYPNFLKSDMYLQYVQVKKYMFVPVFVYLLFVYIYLFIGYAKSQ